MNAVYAFQIFFDSPAFMSGPKDRANVKVAEQPTLNHNIAGQPYLHRVIRDIRS